MSKKEFEKAAEEFDKIGADWGPLLKSLGTVLTEAWQEQNGEFLSKEERSKRKAPLAQVDQSDIQIRMGDTMLTLVPAEEGKAMVSIPVGFSDKATPATIPREWLLGTFLDGLISIFEGNTEVVWKYVQNINAAIDAAAEVDDNGRMKINTKKLADHKYPVDVAEMIESMKRSYTSRSNGSAKVQASFTITKLQQVNPDPEPEPEPPVLSMEERLLQSAPAAPAAVEVAEQVLAESNSNAKPSSDEGVVEADVNASPVPSADVASPQLEDAAHDDPAAPSDTRCDECRFVDSDGRCCNCNVPICAGENEYQFSCYYTPEDHGGEMVWCASCAALQDEKTKAKAVPVATPEEIEQAHENPIITDPPYVEEVVENPHNFKKNPTDWIKHELMIDPVDEGAHTIEDVAELAGCHVQTIKRALDKFEAEAAYVHMQGLDTLKNADEDTPGWVALDVDINDDWILRIECERSPTGRYARGRPILFITMDKDFPNQADHPTAEETAEMVASVLESEAEGVYVDSTDGPVFVEAPSDDPPTLKAVDDTDPSLSPCPNCGTLADPKDTPEDAPDFVCATCHEVLQDEDEDWAEDTKNRREQLRIYGIHVGTVDDAEQAPVPEDEIEEAPAAPAEEAVEEPAEEAAGGLEETIPIHRLINRGA